MTRNAITILHLSDMQFGKFHRFSEKQPGAPPNEFDTLTQRLILDLDYLTGHTHHSKPKEPIAQPDLIICTGDLAEWGMKEFDQAFEFLGKIADHLKLPYDRVIVIPGNHDINWKQCQSYFGECEADERSPRVSLVSKVETIQGSLRQVLSGLSGHHIHAGRTLDTLRNSRSGSGCRRFEFHHGRRTRGCC